MTKHGNLACQIKANKPQDDNERTDYDFENKKKSKNEKRYLFENLNLILFL